MSRPHFTDVVTARHLPALDGLRAIAAFSVVLAHAGLPGILDGVTAFFVLSGFLITTLLLREQEATGRVSLRHFYLRRTLRIFPAYYACVLSSYVIDRVAGNPWPEGLLPSAAGYVVNYFNAFNSHPDTSIAHLWSLGVEEQFYLLWPAVFIALLSFGRSTLRHGLIVLIVFGAFWRSWLYFNGYVGQAYLYNAFDARFDNLAVGCLLATVATEPRMAIVATRIAGSRWMPAITVAVMYALLLGISSKVRHLIGFTLYSVLCAILIVQLLQLHQTVPWRWLDTKVMRFLGTISYPIYLYHGWGLGLGEWIEGAPHFARFAAGVLFTVAGASASYYIVERPFLRLKEHLSPNRATAVAPVGRHLEPGLS